MPEIKVGDTVNYVPHHAHKYDHVVRNGSVELPWVLGLKTVRNGKESVEELSGHRLTEVLEANKKKMIVPPNEVVAIRPNIAWRATVTAVHPADKQSPNGHVDLNVHTERGITLHYGEGHDTERVNIDEDLIHHSCHHPDCDSAALELLKVPDGKPLGDNADLSVVATLNAKIKALIEENAALKQQPTDK